MKTAPILDPDTFNKVHHLLQRCRWTGASIPEVLNREGLLWTPDRERQIKAATIRFIADEMGNWSPAEFLRRRNKNLEAATPAELYICILEWIQEHAAHAMIQDQ